MLCIASALKRIRVRRAPQNAPSYKSIKNLLVTLKDSNIPVTQEEKKTNSYGITRGARYYAHKSGGKHND